jgi:uncharacterized protein YacL
MDFIILLLLVVIVYKLYGSSLFNASSRSQTVILDSCALIDGRIVELAKAGFVPANLIVPGFILHELQLLADSADAHKRERARYGLDVVRELKDSRHLKVVIDHERMVDHEKIDDKLVALALKRGASLYTTDYNLNKVADIKEVTVLNVNELAGALRPVVLPGEDKKVKILQKGSSADQGVGYLEDGTMIVVEHGARYIGKTISVTVTRMHQTMAGKMIFGEIVSNRQSASGKQNLVFKRPRSKTTAQKV